MVITIVPCTCPDRRHTGHPLTVVRELGGRWAVFDVTTQLNVGPLHDAEAPALEAMARIVRGDMPKPPHIKRGRQRRIKDPR